MTDWRKILTITAQFRGKPLHTEKGKWTDEGGRPYRLSWCSWTTFGRLGEDSGYWTAELPEASDLGERAIIDGGTWTQPFDYNDLAHLIIPRQFSEEHRFDPDQGNKPGFWRWTHTQAIDQMSALLTDAGIEHSLSEWALDIKRF